MPRSAPDGYWLVASAGCAKRPDLQRIIYVEHGAGQAYPGDPASSTSGSYSGGPGHERVVLFIAPGEHVADRWRDAYPDTPTAVVGCPRLDHHHQIRRLRAERPRVAVSFHWPCPLIPETQWALPHHRRALEPLTAALRGVDATLVGHGHPRAWRALSAVWGRLGVPAEPDAGVVLATADLLIADNTSLLPEAASCGIPLLWLNAPWWRRNVHHGGRFWEWPRGQYQADDPDDLPALALAALDDPPPVRAAREAMVSSIYAHSDGHAAERAAAAILEVI
jgi:hypothetical protein